MPDVQRVCWFAYPPAIEGELGLRLVATISGRLSMTMPPSPFSLSDPRSAINVMQPRPYYHSKSESPSSHPATCLPPRLPPPTSRSSRPATPTRSRGKSQVNSQHCLDNLPSQPSTRGIRNPQHLPSPQHSGQANRRGQDLDGHQRRLPASHAQRSRHRWCCD